MRHPLTALAAFAIGLSLAATAMAGPQCKTVKAPAHSGVAAVHACSARSTAPSCPVRTKPCHNACIAEAQTCHCMKSTSPVGIDTCQPGDDLS